MYSKIYCIFFFTFFSITGIKADDPPAKVLLDFEDLTFDNERERELFLSISRKESIEYLDLFYYSCNPTINQSQYEHFVSRLSSIKDELEAKKIMNKKPDKRIKLIQSAAHEALFEKYEYNVNFNKILENGTYNCLTASAVYGYLLDQFQYPYIIKESPDHVFIVAHPKTYNIVLESTDPTGATVSYEGNFKTAFVQRLKEFKIISDQEYKSKNVSELFEEYYFPKDDIGLKELAALHYWNYMLSLMEKNSFEDAFEEMKKAYFLYPCDRHLLMLITLNAILLENTTYATSADINRLLFLTKFISQGVDEKSISNEFTRLTYNYLVENYQPARYDSIFETFTPVIESEDLKKELKFIYNYERGRVCLNRGQFKGAYKFTREAFQLKPQNSDAQINFISSLNRKILEDGSCLKSLNELEKIASDFPDILTNNNFILIMGYCHLNNIEELYKAGQAAKGLEMISRFEDFIKLYPNVRFEDNLIGRAYSEAATYYFKKGYDKKSFEILTKGMKLAPGSEELKVRYQMIR